VEGCVSDNGTHITYDLSWRKFNCDRKITVSDGQHDYDLAPGKIFALNLKVFKTALTAWDKEVADGKTTLSLSESYELEDWGLDVDPTMKIVVPSENVVTISENVLTVKKQVTPTGTTWSLGVTYPDWTPWLILCLALVFCVALIAVKKPRIIRVRFSRRARRRRR
jgi:hypothetical protein